MTCKTCKVKLEAYVDYLKSVDAGEIAALRKEEVIELLNNLDRWTHPDISTLVAKFIEKKTKMKLL